MTCSKGRLWQAGARKTRALRLREAGGKASERQPALPATRRSRSSRAMAGLPAPTSGEALLGPSMPMLHHAPAAYRRLLSSHS